MSGSHLDCKSVRIRPMLPTDALDIELRRWDAADLAGADLAALGRRLAWDSLVAWTLEESGGIVACGGVLTVPGMPIGEVWAVTSDRVVRRARSCLRAARDGIARADGSGLVRLQTLVLPENRAAVRFIERLGFAREGLLRRCGHNGLDRYLYARIR
jgi:hypothetical protein